MNNQFPPHIQALIDQHNQGQQQLIQGPPQFMPNPANPLTSQPLPKNFATARTKQRDAGCLGTIRDFFLAALLAFGVLGMLAFGLILYAVITGS